VADTDQGYAAELVANVSPVAYAAGDVGDCTLVTDLYSPTLHVSDTDRLVAAATIVASYAALRIWRKNGGPARCSLIALRKAALGRQQGGTNKPGSRNVREPGSFLFLRGSNGYPLNGRTRSRKADCTNRRRIDGPSNSRSPNRDALPRVYYVSRDDRSNARRRIARSLRARAGYAADDKSP
jgi:hypothetical protein